MHRQKTGHQVSHYDKAGVTSSFWKGKIRAGVLELFPTIHVVIHIQYASVQNPSCDDFSGISDELRVNHGMTGR